jgi:hypothetical protein
MPKLFISYRRHESADATGRLYDRLKAHFGAASVFYDVDTIPLGVDFRKHLGDQVGKCDVFLAVIGDGWLKSRFKKGLKKGQRRLDDPADWVRIEIEAALARGIPVVPVLVGLAAMPSDTDLPDSLKELSFRQAVEVRSGADYDGHADRLIRALDRIFIEKDQALLVQKQEEVRDTVKDVQKDEEDPPHRKGPKRGEIISNSLGMKLAFIKPGTFLMGSPRTEECRFDNERQHRVKLTKGFYMGVHLVTQEQWQAVMGSNPSHFKGEYNLPVEQVSWGDCQEFLRRLSEKEGTEYRLPTEAEWEYACRAGTTSMFCFGEMISTEQANYDGTSPDVWGRKGKGCTAPLELDQYHNRYWTNPGVILCHARVGLSPPSSKRNSYSN